jgi:hypothetical protein
MGTWLQWERRGTDEVYALKRLMGNVYSEEEETRGWENNINIYLRAISSKAGNWVKVDKNRVQWWALVATALNLQLSYNLNVRTKLGNW